MFTAPQHRPGTWLAMPLCFSSLLLLNRPEHPMKITKTIIFAIAPACCATAFADTQDIQSANSQIGIQVISTNVNYTETGNGRLGTATGTLDTDTGAVPGYAISVSVMKDWFLGNDYLQFQYSRNQGHTDYTGSPASGGAFGSLVQQNGATLTDYSLRLGKGFAVSQQVMLTPFAEFGRHEWKRAVNQGETYTNNYFGVGALAQYSPLARLVLSANALLGKTSGANISVAGPTAFSGALGNSTLYKVGLSADYAFTKNFHGNVGINYSAFDYGASASYRVGNRIVWEPDSQTRYTTVSAGVGYAF